MKKWNVLVAGDDGRKFFMHYHVIASDADAAKRHLVEVLMSNKATSALQVKEVEELEAAEMFLPGVVYKSGKAYFA